MNVISINFKKSVVLTEVIHKQEQKRKEGNSAVGFPLTCAALCVCVCVCVCARVCACVLATMNRNHTDSDLFRWLLAFRFTSLRKAAGCCSTNSACCIKSFAPFRQQEFWVISALVYLAQFWLCAPNGPMKAQLLHGSLAAAVNPDWWISEVTRPYLLGGGEGEKLAYFFPF